MDDAAYTALKSLRAGNARFVSGDVRPRVTPADRTRLVGGQRPWAVIVGCSDSRVPVETLFDAGPGELFVVRSAGHVLSEAGYVSVRYAVQALGARLVVILGHDECGAVAAARSGNAPDYLRPVTDHIHTDASTLEVAVDQHVRESVGEMRDWLAAAGFPGDDVPVIGSAYQLSTGEVHWLT